MAVERSADIEATPDDVAALLTARTKDDAGRELGVWTDETRPTVDQVQQKIDIARTVVSTGVSVTPDSCLEAREAAVCLLASMLVEQSFWPEQTESNQSTWARLRELYLEAKQAFVICAGGGEEYGAYDLDVSGLGDACWPWDWWQRDLDNTTAKDDALWERAWRRR